MLRRKHSEERQIAEECAAAIDAQDSIVGIRSLPVSFVVQDSQPKQFERPMHLLYRDLFPDDFEGIPKSTSHALPKDNLGAS